MAKIKLKLNPDKLKEWALDAVRESEAVGGPGTAKFERAREAVVKHLDDLLTFGKGPIGLVAEALTDAALRIIAGPVVEWAWGELFGRNKGAA